MRKVKAAAAALTGPPAAPTTGQRDAAIHRTQPAARGRQSGIRRQIEMVVRHYHFYQTLPDAPSSHLTSSGGRT
jgi:hypothetical protein